MNQRPEHTPLGNPCFDCGLPASQHRKRHRKHRSQYDKPRSKFSQTTFIGIDGEGQGRDDHRYVYLAASDTSQSLTWEVEAKQGKRLTTVECLDLILSLPTTNVKIFAYSFNYDLTKILTDLDNASLYYLFRPELRQRANAKSNGPWPVSWDKYKLNLQGTKFTVYGPKDEEGRRKRVTVWDLFRFYGCKFVSALKDWKVGSDDLWRRMTLMKDKRSEFDKVAIQDVKSYCLEECACMAELGMKLVEAHIKAGLTLKSYYGAGSSGAAMLTSMGIKEKIVNTSDEMREAVACAFFGGRFENSIIGNVHEKVYGYDISSAYPYQLYFLPFLEHGKWHLSKNRKDLDGCKTALVKYKLPKYPRIFQASWAPFPFRDTAGSICFPAYSGGGWVWKDEYLAGESFAPNVEFVEAWIYETECDCKPFSKVADYYILRLKIGKEGPGIVIKLGLNSCYGKLAQSVGNSPFNNWIWAGMITSGCRAQLLKLISKHRNRKNALMVATDGLYTRERLSCPTPVITGTDIDIEGKRKPLGGWEETIHEGGVFIARPGIYFPLNPTIEQLKSIKARGVGKGVVLENWEKITNSYKNGTYSNITIANVNRFCGAKTSISRRMSEDGSFTYHRASGIGGPSYGQWVERQIEMSFDPMPKRMGINPDNTLSLRVIPEDRMSIPYPRAMKRKEVLDSEAEAMIKARTEIMEQPDKDYTEYVEGEEYEMR